MKQYMKRSLRVLLSLVCVAAAGQLAQAADNGTEFGIEDDLTVIGSQGTALDPDAEVKGFTVFGATQAAYTGAVVGAGNVVVNGYLAVSSGAYFVGGSTFASGGAYFTGVSSFSNVANIHIAGGAANQVLKKVAGGGMAWDDVSALVTGDNLGNHTSTANLIMTGYNVVGARYITASSAALSGQMIVYGTSTLAGNTGITGTLDVSGNAALNGNLTLGNNNADLLTMNAQASFIGGSTFTTGGAYFTGVSSFSNVANIHIAGGAAGQVLTKVAGGGMQWDSVSSMVTGDNLGNHVATTTLNMATFDIRNANYVAASSAGISGQLVVYGTSTLTGLVGMGGALNVNGDVDLNARLNVDLSATFVSSVTVKNDTQFGDATTEDHAINTVVEDGVALKVAGEGVAGKYVAKFYSGDPAVAANLAAWIKKK